jgi:hypothetical protein
MLQYSQNVIRFDTTSFFHVNDLNASSRSGSDTSLAARFEIPGCHDKCIRRSALFETHDGDADFWFRLQ